MIIEQIIKKHNGRSRLTWTDDVRKDIKQCWYQKPKTVEITIWKPLLKEDKVKLSD